MDPKSPTRPAPLPGESLGWPHLGRGFWVGAQTTGRKAGDGGADAELGLGEGCASWLQWTLQVCMWNTKALQGDGRVSRAGLVAPVEPGPRDRNWDRNGVQWSSVAWQQALQPRVPGYVPSASTVVSSLSSVPSQGPGWHVWPELGARGR